ncbi:ArsR family transcriptional regulator [Saliphagus sp. LR7]|uniref:ArsR family transcriptional regulator n=1 Tax=Saliphagus sp. LR7 TaxID=2282654 RepID=UPI001E363E79|nr:ArsR family transcriptional regulator [Saliphagus sp. LR7]
MVDVPPLVIYDLLIGMLSGLGLIYLLYSRRTPLVCQPPLVLSFAGLFLFILGDPLAQLLYSPAIHVTHGVAALLIAYGLYDPTQNRIRRTEWSVFFLRDPSMVRSSPEWMTPMDDQVLLLLQTAEITLTPAIIAFNIDRSREAVNRRLKTLVDHGFVNRPDRGKYELSPAGRRYLNGKTGPGTGDD